MPSAATNTRVLLCQREAERTGLERELRALGHVVVATPCASKARELIASGVADVLLVDLDSDHSAAIELLGDVRRHVSDVDVVALTSHGMTDTAVRAMSLGAADYLTKPVAADEMDVRLRRLAELRQQRHELARLRILLGEEAWCPGLRPDSRAMHAVGERIQLAASSAAPVLLLGERGTGKELVARTIHAAGPRRGEPLVGVACRAIAPHRLATALFGSNDERLPGALERAKAGTLLLDAIDALPGATRDGLRRVLLTGVARRVGGTCDVAVDARLVATTEADPARTSEGMFFAALMRELRGIEIRLPPLRERGDDVVRLAHHFLRLLVAANGGEPKLLSREVVDVFMRYAWPGNAGELQRVVASAHASSASSGGEREIRVADLPEEIRGPSRARSSGP